jgi:hypothetical protein
MFVRGYSIMLRVITSRNGTKYWHYNGLLHRIGSPAKEYSDGTKYWYLYGEYYTESDYNKWMSNIPLLYWNRFKKGKWI